MGDMITIDYSRYSRKKSYKCVYIYLYISMR
jgi:hypothetical protein